MAGNAKTFGDIARVVTASAFLLRKNTRTLLASNRVAHTFHLAALGASVVFGHPLAHVEGRWVFLWGDGWWNRLRKRVSMVDGDGLVCVCYR